MSLIFLAPHHTHIVYVSYIVKIIIMSYYTHKEMDYPFNSVKRCGVLKVSVSLICSIFELISKLLLFISQTDYKKSLNRTNHNVKN